MALPVILPSFPLSLLRETSSDWTRLGQTAGSGQTAAGIEPLTTIDGGGMWTCTMTDINLVTPDQILAWRAVDAVCDGGTGPILVPRPDKRFFPAPLLAGVRLSSVADVGYQDGALHSDGSGFYTSTVRATLMATTALRTTKFNISLFCGSPLRGGESFSIDHAGLRSRMYTVRTAVDNHDGTFAISVRPPLRADTPAGTNLNFDRPECVMRLATPDAMRQVLSLRRYAKTSVTFKEAMPPFPDSST